MLRKIMIVVFSLLVLGSLFGLSTALAGEERTGPIVHIQADEVIEEDLYAAAEEIVIDGRVQGDLVATGRFVRINGTVEGDVVAMAQVVEINGEVNEDLMAGAQVIMVDGLVGDDILAGCFSLETSPESDIRGDIHVGSYQALIDGEVGADVMGGMAALEIAGHVGGDVDMTVGEETGGFSPVSFMSNMAGVPPLPAVATGFTLADDARIGGSLTYRATQQMAIDEAQVGDQIRFIQEDRAIEEAGIGSFWVGQFKRLLRLWLFGAWAAWLLPGFLDRAGRRLNDRLLPSLAWGALTPVAFGLLLVILVILSILIGLPILVYGGLTFGYLLILFYGAVIVVGRCFGHWLLVKLQSDWAENLYLTTLLGLTAIWAVTLIPVAGFIIGLFIILFGAGGLWLAVKKEQSAPTPAS